MNFVEAEAELRKFVKDAAIVDEAYVAWPDRKFTVPERETWVRFDCQEVEGRQASIGSPSNNRFRHFGVVTLQVFQPQGQGSKDARSKAAAALGAFMGATTTNGIVFENAVPRRIGNDGNGFYQINVVVSFYYDELT